MAHSTPETRNSQQAVLRPIIAIWGLSLCFLVGLIIGVPQASQPGAERNAVSGKLATGQRLAAIPGYGFSSLAVERFDREMAAKGEACTQADAHKKVQARVKTRSRATPRPNPVPARTRS